MFALSGCFFSSLFEGSSGTFSSANETRLLALSIRVLELTYFHFITIIGPTRLKMSCAIRSFKV